MNGLVADTIEVLGRPRNGIWFLSGFWHRVNELDEGNAVISGFQTSEKRAVTFNAKTSTCIRLRCDAKFNVRRAQEHERTHLASRSENTHASHPETHPSHSHVRNVEYSILLVMSELSTVRCNRALGLWLQVHGRQVSTESGRGGAVADGPCGGRR